MTPKMEMEMTAFVERLIKQLDTAGLLAKISEIDHACYRVDSVASYENYKVILSQSGLLLSEAYINGRPIATYKLKKPIKITERFSISLIELPAPKPGSPYTQGFEHIEAVTGVDLKDFKCADGLVKFHKASLEKMISEEQRALKKNPRKVAVLFDFDETLADSKIPFLKASQRALEKFLQRPLNFDDVCKSARPTFPEFFANFGITEQSAVKKTIELFQTEWDAFADDARVCEGVTSFLSCLRSEGIKAHVWTARDTMTTRKYLEKNGLATYFDEIYGFDGDGKTGKPIASAVLKAKCKGQRCVVIGDSDSDLAGAQNLGAYFLQAVWVRSKPLNVEASAVCKTPFEALMKVMTHLSSSNR